jgi:hypothetical protein
MKILNRMLTTAVFSAGLIAAGHANAVVMAPTDLAVDGSPTLKIVSGATFNDVFSFHLGYAADVEINGTSPSFDIPFGSMGSLTVPAVDFSGFKLTSATGGFFSQTGTDFSIGDGTFSYNITGLSAGDYLFELKGKTNGSYGVGAYGLAALAVPEPGEWAMMLAGLGMVGAMVRRRIAR